MPPVATWCHLVPRTPRILNRQSSVCDETNCRGNRQVGTGRYVKYNSQIRAVACSLHPGRPPPAGLRLIADPLRCGLQRSEDDAASVALFINIQEEIWRGGVARLIFSCGSANNGFPRFLHIYLVSFLIFTTRSVL